MSTRISREVSCPHCGETVKTEMWPGIRAQENPELRGRALGETLFDWTCPACGYAAQLVYPCLYHDEGRKFMIYLVPNGDRRSMEPVDVGADFPQLKGIVKRVVTSPAQLKEKILIFEAGLNDLAVELLKLAITDVAGKKRGIPVDGAYFCALDGAEERITFSFFLPDRTKPVCQSTRLEAYRKSLEVAVAAGGPEPETFAAVDSAAAQQALRKYRGEED